MRAWSALLCTLAFPEISATAEPIGPFGFSAVFGSRMVLQRAPAKAAVFGSGCDGEVSVNLVDGIFHETVVATMGASAGEWKALLLPKPAGGAYTVTATCAIAVPGLPVTVMLAKP